MRKEDSFFLVFLCTILVTRIILYLAGQLASDPDALGFTLFGVRLHHYMYGALLMIVAIFFPHIHLFSIGMGLFVDELTYLLMAGTTRADNYSWISLLGTLIFVFIVFVLRRRILQQWRKYATLRGL